VDPITSPHADPLMAFLFWGLVIALVGLALEELFPPRK